MSCISTHPHISHHLRFIFMWLRGVSLVISLQDSSSFLLCICKVDCKGEYNEGEDTKDTTCNDGEDITWVESHSTDASTAAGNFAVFDFGGSQVAHNIIL